MTGYIQQKTLYRPQIRQRVANTLGLVVVIPVYDEPFLLRTLMNLQKCDLPKCAVEVLIIVNNGKHVSEKILERNRATYLQAMDWSKANFKPLLKFHVLFHDELPKFFANRDVALKIGMDEAIFRLEKAKAKRGIIATLDADFRVEKNYFTALETYFRKRKVPRICQTKFAFPLTGIDYEDKIYAAALQYELSLRYLAKSYTYAGFSPDLTQIPTSIAVDAMTYQKRGGWSSALGSSHLLQDVFLLDKTVVTSSPRIINCRANGTGARIKTIIKNKGIAETYHPACFQNLKHFFLANGHLKKVIQKELKECPSCISDYFSSVEFSDCDLNGELFSDFFAKAHLTKYLEFAHQKHYKKIPVKEALGSFFSDAGELSDKDLLLKLRS